MTFKQYYSTLILHWKKHTIKYEIEIQLQTEKIV
jgi:hypothetical protein